MSTSAATIAEERGRVPSLFVAVLALVTLVDLFAAQAVLPLVANRFGVGAALAGAAINATTAGMAMGGLLVARWGGRIEQRRGIVAALMLLSVPTALLAVAPNLVAFTLLRVVQGVLMGYAFGLALSYLGARWEAKEAGIAFGAYVTGNIVSNLLGRIAAAWAAELWGVRDAFLLLASVNLVGALIVATGLAKLGPARRGMVPLRMGGPLLARRDMRAALLAGFALLFAFVGVFTFVGVELTGPRFGLGMMTAGAIHLVFLPAIATTPAASRLAAALGARTAMLLAVAVAVVGTLMLLASALVPFALGLMLVAIGTFGAQAIATGHVAAIAPERRQEASGAYLASYFAGGVAGTIVVGQLYAVAGWAAAVAASAAALIAVGCAANGFEARRAADRLIKGDDTCSSRAR